MIKRLRQAVTFALLVFFAVENMLPAAIDSHAENFSIVDRVSTPTDHCNVFSWVLEENETEERDDQKTHSDQVAFVATSVIHAQASKAFLSLPLKSVLRCSQKLLRLIHLLRI
jgi:hypothetical protein